MNSLSTGQKSDVYGLSKVESDTKILHSERLALNDEVSKSIAVAEKIFDNDLRSLAFLNISEELIKKGLFRQALKVAEMIPDNEINRTYALRNISNALEKNGEINKAIAVANMILNNNSRNRIFLNLSEKLIEKGLLDKALEVVMRIPVDEIERSRALCYVSKVLVKNEEIIEATVVAKRILHYYSNSSALGCIVNALMEKGYFIKALTVTDFMIEDGEKSRVLRNISKALEENDINMAIAVAERIPDNYLKSEALLSVSKILQRKNRAGKAKEVASTIPNDFIKSLALQGIRLSEEDDFPTLDASIKNLNSLIAMEKDLIKEKEKELLESWGKEKELLESWGKEKELLESWGKEKEESRESWGKEKTIIKEKEKEESLEDREKENARDLIQQQVISKDVNINKSVQRKSINENQERLIDAAIEFILEDIAKLPPSKALKAFRLIRKKAEWNKKEEAFLKEHGCLEGVSSIREILAHPYPQNRKEGDPATGYGPKGEKDGVVYYFQRGGKDILSEPKGLLGLTEENNAATPPITEKDVVAYVNGLITKQEKAIIKGIALEAGIEVPDNSTISRDLWDISKGLVQKDVNKAIAVAKMISNSFGRSWAFWDISKVLAERGDIDKALAVAKHIPNVSIRSLALQDIEG